MAAPYRAQDVQEVAQMLRGLEDNRNRSKGGNRGGVSCKKATFDVQGSEIKVDSWRMMDWDYKRPNLPTYARGLFTTRTSKGQPEIAVRGYDKFFNHGEVRETEWQNVESNTQGPYELSVKENGCIIFLAGLEDGTLIVCSKHSTGERHDTDASHAKVGDDWVDRHLHRIGKTRLDLAKTLREMNATAVAELCDDDFEEHVLAYSPDSSGLYLHGINLNLPGFATYPHDLVNKFADEWGFKKTTFIVKDDIHQVKTFLERIAETGNYEGRDTEGFVIRCRSKANTGEWHDWFFKYKFEEPYLMYRQWRECTKAVIAGKQPKYKKHKKITEDYLLFARKQLHGNPGLGKAYQANHGIIKMREDFLAYRGLKGSDIIRQEAQEGEVSDEAVTEDVLLATVATLGCGKTTVSLALSRLFDWGHIQNDNITVKKGKPMAFATECTKLLAQHSATIADRNNHQRRERQQLIHDVSRIVPNVHFVCLHYVHDRSDYDRIREATRQRVLSRGDNHQTIHSNTKGSEEIIGIMEGFLHRFEPVNQEASPDDGFDLVIDLDPCASSRGNLETIINRLYVEYPKLFADQDMPSSEDMDAAIAAAMNDYTVDLKHEIKGRDNWRPQNGNRQTFTNGANGQPSTPSSRPKEKKLEYFAIHLPTPRVNAILESLFRDATPEQARMYRALQQQRRIQPSFHVTLIHRANSTDSEHAAYWTALSALHAKDATPADPEPKLGFCQVRLERVVWDDRVMTFVVRLHSPTDHPPADAVGGWKTTNAVAHATVGTASADIKPFESNALLERWLERGEEGGVQELMVEGNVELGGIVTGVLQKH